MRSMRRWKPDGMICDYTRVSTNTQDLSNQIAATRVA